MLLASVIQQQCVAKTDGFYRYYSVLYPANREHLGASYVSGTELVQGFIGFAKPVDLHLGSNARLGDDLKTSFDVMARDIGDGFLIN